jgi:hypothetical protein
MRVLSYDNEDVVRVSPGGRSRKKDTGGQEGQGVGRPAMVARLNGRAA